jgi:hypothetical protein
MKWRALTHRFVAVPLALVAVVVAWNIYIAFNDHGVIEGEVRDRAGRLLHPLAAGGLAAGLALWDYEMRASRRHLFSRNPLKRLAALGYLGATPSVETARLLRDYVNWESRPELRRRGLRLLRRIESALA